MVGERVSVIRHEQNDGVLEKPFRSQVIQQLSDIVIYIGDFSGIEPSNVGDLFLSEIISRLPARREDIAFALVIGVVTAVELGRGKPWLVRVKGVHPEE